MRRDPRRARDRVGAFVDGLDTLGLGSFVVREDETIV